jgi:peptidoglycan/xylan/chitin deacetylase (PgdA/CDA1 family)
MLTIAGLAHAERHAVVLMYHRFGEDRHPSTSVRLEQFDAHLEHLDRHGFHVVPLTEIVAAIEGGAVLPDSAVAITIDDAYRSIHTEAWPRLRTYGFPFTVFVSTDAVDQRLTDYLSWDQMREMERDGVDFANHGASHASLIERLEGESETTWRERVLADVEKGARRLREELEPVPGLFAYPYGEYDATVAAMVEELGYASFGQQSGAIGTLSDRRALPRYPMAEAFADIDDFATKVASLPLPVAAIEPWDPVTTKRRPRLVLTLAPTAAALDRLACFVSGVGRVEVEWLEPQRRFAIEVDSDLPLGRSRCNCTAPAVTSGRFHWFSHQWVVRRGDR